MARTVETEKHLRRCAAGGDQSENRAFAHLVLDGGNEYGPPLLLRSQLAEYPDPHRERQKNPRGFHSRKGTSTAVGRLQSGGVAACRGAWQYSGAKAGFP